MIVDASAIAAILFEEADAARYTEALEAADNARLSAGTYVELGVVVDERRNPLLGRRLDDVLTTAQIVIEPVTERQDRIARDAYRDYAREAVTQPGSISATALPTPWQGISVSRCFLRATTSLTRTSPAQFSAHPALLG